MARTVRVWDLPTRLFHWLLAALVVVSFVTVKAGGNWLQIHFYSGYAIVVLIAFRIIWGFIGGRYARFSSFLFGPGSVLRHLRGSSDAPRTLGHNPLGAFSVYALIIVIGLQAAGGLFANDDIASEGPLAKLISKGLSDRITSLHHLGEFVILTLVALHLVAVLYYLLLRRDNLVRPMLTGDKPHDGTLPSTRDDAALRLRGLIVLALCALALWALLRWAAGVDTF